MSQYLVSVIRTWVPIAIGWLISQLLVLGVVLDPDSSELLQTGVTALVIALYYAVARWLETKFPNAGVLLGFIRQPIYLDPTKTLPEQQVAVDKAASVVAKSVP